MAQVVIRDFLVELCDFLLLIDGGYILCQVPLNDLSAATYITDMWHIVVA